MAKEDDPRSEGSLPRGGKMPHENLFLAMLGLTFVTGALGLTVEQTRLEGIALVGVSSFLIWNVVWMKRQRAARPSSDPPS